MDNTEKIVRVLFDAHAIHAVQPAVQIETVFDPDSGVMTVSPLGIQSGWLALVLADGKLTIEIHQGPDDESTHTFVLDEKNHFVPC